MRLPVRILALVVLMPLSGALLSGCTVPPSPLPTSGGSTPVATPSPSPSPTPSATAAEIADAAEAAAGTGTAVAVEDESGGRSWQATVVDDEGAAQEVHLDTTATVTSGPMAVPTRLDDRSDNRALVAASTLTLAAAQERMTRAVPDGQVTAIELGEFRDQVVWQGDVTDVDGVRHDVRIDAVDGSVLLDRADRTAADTNEGGS